jgi:DNA polymerase-3 subunit gamma/tau
MYYLQYRPRTVTDLDNVQARNALSALLQSKTLPHALLFTGQKGTGKTSAARIVAKAINCLENRYAEKGDSYEPCNCCTQCTLIEAGSSPDVVEMDAASNRGIDEVRQLIRESSYAPMSTRYKVYIIDEAHMITTDAFNALLKTLEEPPPSTIFILATTNEEKIPRTIVSRCMNVFFGKAKREDIIQMLTRVADTEGVSLSPDVAKLIASYSEYSFRDASKILEDLVIQKKLTLDEVTTYLGLHGEGTFLEVLRQKKLSEALDWLRSFSQNGGNAKHLLESILSDLHDQLMTENNLSMDYEVTPLGFSNKELTTCMKLFTDAHRMLKISPIDILPLEIATVEYYEFVKKGGGNKKSSV